MSETGEPLIWILLSVVVGFNKLSEPVDNECAIGAASAVMMKQKVAKKKLAIIEATIT
jgi:hypothetical protein